MRLIAAVCVRLPDVPVIVIVTVPVAAVALAAKVSVLVAVAGLGLKEAVTPLGNPDAESVTLPVKPFIGVMAIALVPWLPCTRLNALGAADNVKPGAAVTVTLIAAFCVRLPEVPVVITVTVPVAAVVPAIKVSVLAVAAGLGLKEAVTPLGNPDAENATLPLKPFDGVMVIVLVALLPGVMATLFGEVESVKFGIALPFTVRLNVVV